MEKFVGVDGIYHVNLAINVFTRMTFAMVMHNVMTTQTLLNVVQIMMLFVVFTRTLTPIVQQWIFLQITRNVILVMGTPTTKNMTASHVEMKLKRINLHQRQ